MFRWISAIVFIVTLLPTGITAASSPSTIRVDKDAVREWNRFVDELEVLHKRQINNQPVTTRTRIGGYATHPEFYKETRFFAEDGRLLSRIQRVRHNPDLIHLIEVNIYDEKKVLTRDYLAAYLPEHRNAPIQTLINLHAYNDDLHAFRQFDASGNRIYEQCKGKYKQDEVLISLEEDEFAEGPFQNEAMLQSPVYQTCFKGLPMEPTHVHSSDKPGPSLINAMNRDTTYESVQARIEMLGKQLDTQPDNTHWLIERGNLYFLLHDFDLAVLDFTDAIKLDATLDDAYFGRGMALARSGQVKEGIADISVYIERNPKSSMAYTKRGVRYLWSGDDKRAEQDFVQALSLDPDNAEAHDDLGVIFARRGNYGQALDHFTRTVSIDPTYLKGYHNLAMVYYITGQDVLALDSIEKVLAVTPQARDSLMLKAEILDKLGDKQAAAAIKQEAEFLPEGNWSEHISVN